MLVYDTNNWEQFIFKKAERENRAIPSLVDEAEKDFKNFKDLLGDICGRLYTGDSVVKKEDLSGLEFYDSAHNTLNNLPEWKKMVEKTKNKIGYSGLATSVIGEVLYDTMPKPKKGDSLYNIPKMQEKIQNEEKLLETILNIEDHNEELVKQVKKNIADWSAKLQQQTELQAMLASEMNGPVIRSTITNKLKDLREKITEMNACSSMFGNGDAPLDSDSSEFAMISEKIRSDLNFREIIKFAGRFKSLISTAKQTMSSHGCSEVTGIELGSELNRVVDSEMVKLRTNRKQFFLDYTENRLMQTHLKGKETKGKGPIIILIDMSGSMSGERNRWAKGLALALVNEAIHQKRDCRIALFNTQVMQQIDINKKEGFSPAKINEFLNFLSVGASGGTNYSAPLDFAMNMLFGNSTFDDNGIITMKDADILMISDGECSVLPSIEEKYNASTKAGLFKFFFVLIGGTVGHQMRRMATDFFSISMKEDSAGEIIKSIIR